MSMKKTLLQIVQDLLSDTDGEPVNALSDSLEAEQIATVVESTFYDIIATRSVPEHEGLVKLTALSDSDFPTHFLYPDNVTDVSNVSYDTSTDGSFDYEPVKWIEPMEFLRRTDGRSENFDNVKDKNGGTNLRIRNNERPTFYTSFDDQYIVMNSYDSAVDTTLQSSKVRAFARTFPIFSRFSDTYVPDLDDEFFPYLVSEARTRVMDLFKGGSTQKAEQIASRNKIHIQNDKHRSVQARNWSNYGR